MSVRGRGLYVASALLAVAGMVLLAVGYVAAAGSATDPETATATTSEGLTTSGGLPEEAEDIVALDQFVDVPAPAFDVAAPAAGMLPVLEIVPTRVRIPSIDVDAHVVDLGLAPDRSLEVPDDISVTGWYTGRSVPGEIGPSVVVGHVDSAIAGKGVFFDLRRLVAGDSIEIERSDGTIAAFRVTEITTVSKDKFPTERVYGSTAQPTLRLITCGGNFDGGVRSYDDNVIVYAEFLGNREAPVSRS